MYWRWLIIWVSAFYALAIVGRVFSAMTLVRPVYERAGLLGEPTATLIGYATAFLLYLLSIYLLVRKNPIGLSLFLAALIVELLSVDRTFYYGMFPLAFLLAIIALISQRNAAKAA
jgi:hypothetical protein